MKAIIISAGQGTRLLPLTLQTPKCLVEVQGRAILDHQITALRAAGVQHIAVVGGYRVEQIAAHLAAAGHPKDIELIVNPFWSVASSISSVWAARSLLQGPFCLLNGDTVFDASVFRQAFADLASGVNLLVEAAIEPELDDMRVQVREGRVQAVGKDLPLDHTSHRSLGVVLCRDIGCRAYATALASVITAEGGHNAYHHAVVHRLAQSAVVTAIENHSGLWCEIDRPEDIERWTLDHSGQALPRRRA